MQTMAFAYPTRQPPPMIIESGGRGRKWKWGKEMKSSVATTHWLPRGQLMAEVVVLDVHSDADTRDHLSKTRN